MKAQKLMAALLSAAAILTLTCCSSDDDPDPDPDPKHPDTVFQTTGGDYLRLRSINGVPFQYGENNVFSGVAMVVALDYERGKILYSGLDESVDPNIAWDTEGRVSKIWLDVDYCDQNGAHKGEGDIKFFYSDGRIDHARAEFQGCEKHPDARESDFTGVEELRFTWDGGRLEKVVLHLSEMVNDIPWEETTTYTYQSGDKLRVVQPTIAFASCFNALFHDMEYLALGGIFGLPPEYEILKIDQETVERKGDLTNRQTHTYSAQYDYFPNGTIDLETFGGRQFYYGYEYSK